MSESSSSAGPGPLIFLCGYLLDPRVLLDVASSLARLDAVDAQRALPLSSPEPPSSRAISLTRDVAAWKSIGNSHGAGCPWSLEVPESCECKVEPVRCGVGCCFLDSPNSHTFFLTSRPLPPPVSTLLTPQACTVLILSYTPNSLQPFLRNFVKTS